MNSDYIAKTLKPPLTTATVPVTNFEASDIISSAPIFSANEAMLINEELSTSTTHTTSVFDTSYIPCLNAISFGYGTMFTSR